jgi:hypothetical protein
MAQSQLPPPQRITSRIGVADRRPEITEPDPDHHLWRNGRLWWIAFTVHLPGWQKERVRQSLGTDDLVEARQRRDELLARYPETRECELSLRLTQRRARRLAVAHPVIPLPSGERAWVRG